MPLTGEQKTWSVSLISIVIILNTAYFVHKKRSSDFNIYLNRKT